MDGGPESETPSPKAERRKASGYGRKSAGSHDFRTTCPMTRGDLPSPGFMPLDCWQGILVTIDEELNLLDQHLRRLKIEYEIFFNNPAKRPPTDIEWKVLNLLRKFSDNPRLKFAQRYRYNEMAQRYAIQSDLWRKKMRIREEGYRRPGDVALAVQGVRESEEREARFPTAYGLSHKPEAGQAAEDNGGGAGGNGKPFSVQCSEPLAEREKVESLFKALVAAKREAGEKTSGSFDSFVSFVHNKTSELRKQHHCQAVEYFVEMHEGKVRLRAKAKS